MSAEKLDHASDFDEVQDDAPRFRILRVDGQRRAFSLEEPFWAALEACAEQQGQRLNQLVAEIVRSNGAKNMTSALRVAAVNWLRQENDKNKKELHSFAHQVVRTHPSPAFVLNSKRQVTSSNTHFLSLLERRGGEPGQTGPIELRLAVPVSALLKHLRDSGSRSMTVGFALIQGTKRVSGRLVATLLTEQCGVADLLCVVRQTEHAAVAGAVGRGKEKAETVSAIDPR